MRYTKEEYIYECYQVCPFYGQSVENNCTKMFCKHPYWEQDFNKPDDNQIITKENSFNKRPVECPLNLDNVEYTTVYKAGTFQKM